MNLAVVRGLAFGTFHGTRGLRLTPLLTLAVFVTFGGFVTLSAMEPDAKVEDRSNRSLNVLGSRNASVTLAQGPGWDCFGRYEKYNTQHKLPVGDTALAQKGRGSDLRGWRRGIGRR